MRKHVRAFTYAPKIPGVRKGTITQTMRKVGKTTIEAGDEILWHGWEGKPYRSPWSWRLRVEVVKVEYYTFREGGVTTPRGTFETYWWAPFMDEMARLDGIDPPTGLQLKRVLKDLNGKDWEGEYMVITWKVKA